MDTEIFEHTVVELKTDIKNILLVSVYRPPNTNASKFLKEYKDAVRTWKKLKHHDLVIGLDHNMDLLELNLDRDLKPTITRPTRITT